ncbi:glyoxalase/bleomycin resistance protein/dioxygenase family protein [Rhizobium phaseoli]|uniref:Glyoxalase/bleomycin resistance protein/dioxygenase family protein n=1 Tax=Rhizobium phaseoli TaxID=396 RepID=A0A192T6J6_9HYPH|nr:MULTISPECIES: VOC family protein [Rhizobium]MDH6649996.1 catechol 2,3-dioxygenase-like lactoylglutathione lyase family enzyme [Rhizobium esperanzae]ANL39336.1 glyoxalase/bleomycin resistance protein/dioxygenase family protein [Rhizobium phaseoli]ANL52069.1 glyoxalase/bleomycin resistance protein/dioxygenase family protein [Rhizobium phaseoli]ANL58325.1 glyoxalase/bleomycin resistance protein/dioxygenase family protein [Rhizobium phaseoli]ANL64559.1 glyoxalase/bleomycin resistance protein/di
MIDGNSILLFVTDAAESASFYQRLLGQNPVEASPTFAMFILPSGLALGLWGKAGVEPAPAGMGGGCDVGFRVATADVVDALHAEWLDRGASILLPPTDLDFGRSFVAADPDGHRLRVYNVAEG